jgi:hypothetical protein
MVREKIDTELEFKFNFVKLKKNHKNIKVMYSLFQKYKKILIKYQILIYIYLFGLCVDKID